MVYAVDGVAFPVRPDAYTSVSSDQVVTGAQRTVGPGAQMTKELLAEKLRPALAPLDAALGMLGGNAILREAFGELLCRIGGGMEGIA